MSRSFKDQPDAVRNTRPDRQVRVRARNRQGELFCADPARPATSTDHIQHQRYGLPVCTDECDGGYEDPRYSRPRFWTTVTSDDLRNGWVVPDRRDSRDTLARLRQEANSALADGAGVDEVDDSAVQPHAHRRNEMWGGGYFD